MNTHARPSITWEEDYRDRVNPQLMTILLHKAIPVLQAVQWRVTRVDEGLCMSELPICSASTNQHGTHQAALISLSADYTGGLALASLLRGIPLAGVHRCTDENSASMWLAAMDVRYGMPSTGHLRACCRIPEDMARLVCERYFAGKRVLATLPVTFTANGDLVAEAEMKYFAQPSIQLRPTAKNSRVSPLFKHRLNASARMIAGLRASSDTGRFRIDAAYDRQAAGPHGELLARRLKGILPQLQTMVSSRTRHGDETLASVPGLRQVVILGAGLDMRPFRLFGALDNPLFFELDLPEMLEERARVISMMEDPPLAARRMIAADFTRHAVDELLLNHCDFDPRLPTCVIYEGCSMYFDQAQNDAILSAIARVLQHPDSCLWSDWVRESVVSGAVGNPAIARFLEGMDELGERFIFGCDHPDRLLEDHLADTDLISVQQYLEAEDPVFATYQFAVSRRTILSTQATLEARRQGV
ncbi:MAG: SAM-dependent methyltransferase [Xanthomonadales bacterium]|nr:SAM-dependent methyltransferase [Xanthomonadales bacterium]